MTVLAGVTLAIETFIIYHYPFHQEQENQFIAIFWYLIAGVILSGLGSILVEKQFFNLSLWDWLLAISHCMIYGIAMLLYFYMCSRIPGTLVALMMSTSAIWDVVAQYTVLSHVQGGNHNLLELFGAGVVLVGSISGSIVKAMFKKNVDNE